MIASSSSRVATAWVCCENPAGTSNADNKFQLLFWEGRASATNVVRSFILEMKLFKICLGKLHINSQFAKQIFHLGYHSCISIMHFIPVRSCTFIQ